MARSSSGREDGQTESGEPGVAPSALDEIDYWRGVASFTRNAACDADARNAQAILDAIADLQGPLEKLNGSEEDAALELSDLARDALVRAFNAPDHGAAGAQYALSQKRVADLACLLGTSLREYCSHRLAHVGIDIWHSNFADVEEEVGACQRVLDSFAASLSSLAASRWKEGGGKRSWQGQAIRDSATATVRQRLSDIIRMREQHHTVLRLLDTDESASLGPSEVFRAFKGIDPLSPGQRSMSRWEAAKEEFQSHLKPMEQQLSSKLKVHLGNRLLPALKATVSTSGMQKERARSIAHSEQVLLDLKRYVQLLKRPRVAQELQEEREALISALGSHIDQLREHFDAIESGSTQPSQGKNMTELVQTIMWAARAKHKLNTAAEVLELLEQRQSEQDGQEDGSHDIMNGDSDTTDRASKSTVHSDLIDFKSEVDAFKRRKFDEWNQDNKERMREIQLDKSGSLMDINLDSGHVELHYNDALVQLLRETRQLRAMGFSIPDEVQKECNTARQFYRHGMILKQVANFYNDISEQMLDCQKAMMLKDAEEFESVLKNPVDNMGKPITWNNIKALESYIEKLQSVAEHLTDKNRMLRHWHSDVNRRVLSLLVIDLVRTKDQWDSQLSTIHNVFNRVLTNVQGVDEKSEEPWKLHWDHQLYKALQVSYKKGLDVLNEALPRKEIDIVFQDGKLQYKPDLADLREKHFMELMRFIRLPKNQLGFSQRSQETGFFANILDGNCASIAAVYERAEQLFGKLQDEVKKYSKWVALGQVELEDLVTENLTRTEDFTENFKMLRQASREKEKIPAEVHHACYAISTHALKQAIDRHIKQLHETLIGVLHQRALDDKEEIERFLTSGKEVLQRPINSVQEIGEARTEARKMMKSMPHISSLIRSINENNTVLRTNASTSSAAAVDKANIDTEWDDLTTKLEQFDTHLEEQKSQLKEKVERKVDEFRNRADSFYARWNELKPKSNSKANPELIITRIREFASSLSELEAERDEILAECGHFDMEQPQFDLLEDAKQDIKATEDSWGKYGEFLEEKNAIGERDWISVRSKLYMVEDFVNKWNDQIRNHLDKEKAVTQLLMDEIERYRKALPMLKFVRGEGWQDEHWAQLFSMLGLPVRGADAVTVENLKLDHFLTKADKLVERTDDIKQLQAQAQGEVTIREALRQLKAWGFDRQFALKQHKSASGANTVVIKDWKDLMTEVADNQALLDSLKDSPYFKPFKEEAQVWEDNLTRLSNRIGLLNCIQRKWLYLEPIFSRGALPQEQPRFKKVDRELMEVMHDIEVDPLVVSFAERPRLENVLERSNEQLDICQRALSQFLEEKRAQFPRFYFIGDDDLLEILGQASNAEVIQTHLNKLFAGISRVEISEQSPNGQQQIIAMLSQHGEHVKLSNAINVDEEVESWLSELADTMKATLSSQLSSCLDKKDLHRYSSQVLCLSNQILFCERIEQAINDGALKGAHDALTGMLKEYTRCSARGDKVLQLKLQSLIMDLIHNIDVAEHLKQEEIASTMDFQWRKQLRFYRQHNGAWERMVQMAEGVFDYTFEYQGNAQKLVYTPLTDKCYLTLTQALALGYGGNPYGPAGTGKTESVKALGQSMGRQVLVFNCDEEFDFKSMARIFQGLVKCGAWGCFDEFNRLEEDVLSSVSQQIQIIQNAIRNHSNTMEFMGKEVDVNLSAGIFVTMNPAGKSYGGRSKMPDNLKQLFRSVAMTVPDNQLIAETVLLSEGFNEAKIIGRKMVSLFESAKQLLSPQQHYDWGLRALKTSLGIAGKFKRQQSQGIELEAKRVEEELVLQAVCITTLPKLTYEDSKRFLELMGDIFPDVNVGSIGDKHLLQCIREEIHARGLKLSESQVNRVLQLHMACSQRIGVMIVGPSGSGKTTLWRLLEGAYRRLGKGLVMHVMNPKAMPRQQLLGHMDPDTREWSDGVLTAAARSIVKEPGDQNSWIVCDGDIDPEWIESLNSVLDDNRLLTLPSGERIQFGDNANFIFECDDLHFASPATISRNGMLYLSEEDIDASMIVESWLDKHYLKESAERTIIENGMYKYFYPALKWVLSQETAIGTTKVGVVNNALSQLKGSESATDFCVRLARGLGALLSETKRQELAEMIAKLSGDRDLLAPDDTFYYSPTGEEQLIAVDAMRRYKAVLRPWIRSLQSVLLVGPEGCGKSTLLHSVFNEISNISIASMSCSAHTSAYSVIQKLIQVCGHPVNSSSGKLLRPKDTEHLLLFLKDVNIPEPDSYDTIQLVSFLHQLVSYGGFHDESLDFVQLERISIVCSISPHGVLGRHKLSNRFIASVKVLNMEYPPSEQMHEVMQSLLQPVLNQMGKHCNTKAMLQGVSGAVMEIWQNTCVEFNTQKYRHYRFSPRIAAELIRSLERYNLNEFGVHNVVAHEANRVFRDRLVDNASRDLFDSIVQDAVRSHLKAVPKLAETFFTTLTIPKSEKVITASGSAALTKVTAEQLEEAVNEGLLAYEREMRELSVTIFNDVLDRAAKFDRVLCKQGGSMLLCGRNGIGRRTTLSVVAHMHGLEVFTPSITRAYSAKSWRNDVKSLLQQVGVDNKRMVLFLEDFQIITSEMLQLVHSLLRGGEVQGLYSNQEFESVVAPLKDEMASMGISQSSVSDFFSDRVAKNLHIVLSMDYNDTSFIKHCESNPALLTQCSVLWLDSWSGEGMRVVPRAIINNAFDDGAEDDSRLEYIVEQMITMHGDESPRRLVDFAEQYKAIVTQKRSTQIEQQTFLRAGLDKLEEAESKVEELSGEAEKQRSALTTKQQEAENALQEITSSMERASNSRKEVEQQKEKLASEEGKLNERKKKVEDELSEVQPQIDAAKQAVGQIKSENLNEIRSLRSPSDAIRDVLEGVLRLLGNQDTSWQAMKKFLGNRGMKEEVMNFDAEKISLQSRQAVEELLKNKASSFEHQNISRVSVAAAPLAKWVKANLQYCRVLEECKPLRDELSGLEDSMEQSKNKLHEYESQLHELDEKVTKLREDFSQRTAEAEQLKMNLQKADDQLQAAQHLLGKLGGEKKRWQAQVQELQAQLSTLPFSSLAAAAFMVYLASANEQERERWMAEWRHKLSLEKALDFKRFISSESEMLKWKAEGMPGDDLSMENGIIILQSVQTPLVIDPSAQASSWLRSHLQKHYSSVESLTAQDSRFTSQLELAVRFGKTLIIEEVESIEPLLFPLLRRDFVHQGMRSTVQIGEKTLEYNDCFKLYLVTRNPQPRIQPSAESLVRRINFSVTRGGLEGQLLGITMQHEQPEIERQKSASLRQEEDMKMQLSELEKALLETLANSSGNILENEALIQQLDDTKASSESINQSLSESRSLQESLDEQRESYRPIAHEASLMFFLLKDLSNLNHAYRFSLNAFIKIYKRSLEKSSSSSSSVSVSYRIANLQQMLTKLVVSCVSRALFKNDRLAFGLHMASNFASSNFDQNKWAFFLGQHAESLGSNSNSASVPDAPSWVRQEHVSSWNSLLTAFPDMHSKLQLNQADHWAMWMRSARPEEECFPSETGNAPISDLNLLLMVQSFRPDRLQSAMTRFACNVLRVGSLSPPTLKLESIYQEESGAKEPVLFLITPGSDPSRELQEFAFSTVGSDHYYELAMGQGRLEEATSLLKHCAESGKWLCLKNVHLVVAWLPTLEKELYALTPVSTFRIFLTSEPHPKFPPSLLENSLKIAFEAPPGVKRNLQRTMDMWNPDYFGGGSKERSQMLFVLAWFHAILQERRNYIPQGWSKFYEFSASDLRTAADIIDIGTADGTLPQWTFVHGLLENAVYGGRIDNDHDLRTLKCYLETIFNDEIIGTRGKRQKALPGTRGTIVPHAKSHGQYAALVESLPDDDSPDIFGLPANINRLFQLTQSEQAISSLKAMNAPQVLASTMGLQETRQRLQPIMSLWERLLTSETREAANRNGASSSMDNASGGHALSPVENFIRLEHLRGTKLFALIEQSLSSLKKALRGQESFTSQTSSVCEYLLRNTVPKMWTSMWDGPSEPSAYLQATVARIRSLAAMVTSSTNEILHQELDLNSFFFPVTFLSALKQQSARATGEPMDTLELMSSWKSEKLAQSCAYVNGLLIQGAQFDGKNLSDVGADALPTSKVPTVQLAWLPPQARSPYAETVQVPLYTSVDRSYALCELQLPVNSSDERIKWRLASTALFLPQ